MNSLSRDRTSWPLCPHTADPRGPCPIRCMAAVRPLYLACYLLQSTVSLATAGSSPQWGALQVHAYLSFIVIFLSITRMASWLTYLPPFTSHFPPRFSFAIDSVNLKNFCHFELLRILGICNFLCVYNWDPFIFLHPVRAFEGSPKSFLMFSHHKHFSKLYTSFITTMDQDIPLCV